MSQTSRYIAASVAINHRNRSLSVAVACATQWTAMLTNSGISTSQPATIDFNAQSCGGRLEGGGRRCVKAPAPVRRQWHRRRRLTAQFIRLRRVERSCAIHHDRPRPSSGVGANRMTCARPPRLDSLADAPDGQVALTSIFLAGFCASTVFGSVTFSTPFLNAASILSASTPSGRPK